MNCFEWKFRLSDFLDGTLPPALAKEADGHVDRCISCMGELKRVRAVIREIQAPARATLPTPIRRKYGPRGAEVPEALKKKNLPWFVRLPIETLAVLFVIVSIIEWTPAIRTFLRGKQQTAFSTGEDGPSLTETLDQPGQPSSKRSSRAATGEASDSADSNVAMDDLEEEEEVVATRSAGGRNRGEIWRFSFQAENPIEQRRKISAYLGDLDRRHKLMLSEEALTGLEVPGGVQFQVQIPEKLTDEMRAALETLGSSAHMAASPTAAGKGLPPFAWYKTRSRQPVPPGLARVVIWIPQI